MLQPFNHSRFQPIALVVLAVECSFPLYVLDGACVADQCG